MVHLKIPRVIGLGLGAGANILCRLAIHYPDKVLGLVAIQPTAAAATVMEQLKVRLHNFMGNLYAVISAKNCVSQARQY